MNLQAFDCEYRPEWDVYSLYIGGRLSDTRITRVPVGEASIEIEGPGVINVKQASVWMAERGPDKKNVRSYDSLEAALHGEQEWVKSVFYGRGGIDALAKVTGLHFGNNEPPAKTTASSEAAPLWTGFKVDAFLKPFVDGICATLVNVCEKETRLNVNMGIPCWFSVSKDSCKDGDVFNVGVRGKLDRLEFKFNGEKNGCIFAVKNGGDLKHDFYLFTTMIQRYREDKGLPVLDVDYILDITEKDSPPVTGANYASLNGVYLSGILDYIDKAFRGLAYRALHGKYAFTIYSENGADRDLPPECVQICQRFLDVFKRLYSVDGAVLFCVRDTGKQYVYFYVKEKGLFYNTEDSSETFLKLNLRYLAEALSIAPEDVINEKVRSE
jgi:hypothetical protein